MGEWGPLEVPTTRKKRRARWWAVLWLVVATAVVFAYGYWMYTILR